MNWSISSSIDFFRADILASLCLMTARHTASFPSERTSPVRLAGCVTTLAISLTCSILPSRLSQMEEMSSADEALESNLTL